MAPQMEPFMKIPLALQPGYVKFHGNMGGAGQRWHRSLICREGKKGNAV